MKDIWSKGKVNRKGWETKRERHNKQQQGKNTSLYICVISERKNKANLSELFSFTFSFTKYCFFMFNTCQKSCINYIINQSIFMPELKQSVLG